MGYASLYIQHKSTAQSAAARTAGGWVPGRGGDEGDMTNRQQDGAEAAQAAELGYNGKVEAWLGRAAVHAGTGEERDEMARVMRRETQRRRKEAELKRVRDEQSEFQRQQEALSRRKSDIGSLSDVLGKCHVLWAEDGRIGTSS